MRFEELKNIKILGDIVVSWFVLVDDEIVSGIVEAEREVIKIMEILGMFFLFILSNIFRVSENGDIVYINLGMETILVDISFEFEENECMIVDELFDLDNDILCFIVEINE